MIRRSLSLALLIICGWCGPSLSGAATYLNCGTSEPAINAAGTTLWCDDFEDGDFVYTQDDRGYAPNDGWGQRPNAPPGTFPDPAGGGGHAFGRCQTATGVALVTGLTNTGAAGTNCAGTSGVNVAVCCQIPPMGDHAISQSISITNRDLYVRYYWKCVTPSGCSWSDNTKTHATYLANPGDAGLGIGATGAIPNGRRMSDYGDYNYPPVKGECGGTSDCITNMRIFNSKVDPKGNYGSERWLPQNVAGNAPGVDTGDCSVVPLHTCYEFGDNVNHWYYTEYHIRMNSAYGVDDGWFEMWMDDCGVTGLTGGCATGGTLRTHFEDVRHANSSGHTIGALFMEQHAGGPPQHFIGEWYMDQYVASTVRIGPLGAGGTPSSSASGGLRTNGGVRFQ